MQYLYSANNMNFLQSSGIFLMVENLIPSQPSFIGDEHIKYRISYVFFSIYWSLIRVNSVSIILRKYRYIHISDNIGIVTPKISINVSNLKSMLEIQNIFVFKLSTSYCVLVNWPSTSCYSVIMQPCNDRFGSKLKARKHKTLSHSPSQCHGKRKTPFSPAGVPSGRSLLLLLLPYLKLLFLHLPCVQTSVQRDVKLRNLPSRCGSRGFEEKRRK